MADKYKINRQLVKESRLSQVDFNNMVFGKVYSDHMFVSDYMDGHWNDFRIKPYQLLTLTPGSAILHYGQSVFEGLKAYHGANGDILVFRPEQNARRINVSAERMCIPQVPEDLFMYALVELLKIDREWVPKLPNTSLYIRPYIYALDEYIGIKPSDTYNFIIFTCPVGAYYSKPLKVKIETKYSRSVHGGTGYAKAAGNYAGSLYPAVLAQKVKSGVELAVKFTVLVIIKCVKRVPLPDVEIIVPFPAPGGVLPASLISVWSGYPVSDVTTEGLAVNCWKELRPEVELSIVTVTDPPVYINELNKNPS